MNVWLCYGYHPDRRDAAGRRLLGEVQRQVQACGAAVTTIEAAPLQIRPCRGCFVCWLKTPGRCAIRDDHEPVLQALAEADMRILMTPVTWGGYSSALKKVMDRSIPILLPFFATYHGEIHHPQRYPGHRRLLVIGTQERGDEAEAATFHRLVERNALNMNITAWQSIVLAEDAPAAEAAHRLQTALERLEVHRVA